MLGRFPRLPPRRVCRLSSPPREESGPKGIVGTSDTGTNERTNGASTLEHVAPRIRACSSSCDHMRLASWLHFVYKCTSSPTKPAAGGYFEARPFNEKTKRKKNGRIPTPLSSPFVYRRSKLSQPSTMPDCQYREIAEFILPSM